jgi:hypothetical protein
LHEIGFEFAGTYGEVSALGNPLADRNYRAQVAWAENSGLKLQDFYGRLRNYRKAELIDLGYAQT